MNIQQVKQLWLTIPLSRRLLVGTSLGTAGFIVSDYKNYSHFKSFINHSTQLQQSFPYTPIKLHVLPTATWFVLGVCFPMHATCMFVGSRCMDGMLYGAHKYWDWKYEQITQTSTKSQDE